MRDVVENEGEQHYSTIEVCQGNLQAYHGIYRKLH